jgi:FkbM family methyltransferase
MGELDPQAALRAAMGWWQRLRRWRSDPDRRRSLWIRGVRLKLVDRRSSGTLEGLQRELAADCYGVERVPLTPKDFVIDIGAHVGTFSIYLAKRFPDIRIYAFEPVPETYAYLCRNLELNGVTNVEAYNLAVTRDGRKLPMIAHPSNTGGATTNLRDLQLADHKHYEVESVTLEDIFRDHAIDRCRLLKIDCEGSEYEILLHTPLWSRIDYLSGEFHMNAHLAAQGYSIDELARHCRQMLSPDRIRYTACYMAD